MTTEEKIEIMQAYAEGKMIQHRPNGGVDWADWLESTEPLWDWIHKEYRIKPKDKYRPYNNTSEMIESFEERFKVKAPPYTMSIIWVRNMTTDVRSHVSDFDADRVVICGVSWDMDQLFRNFTYPDGSPCGIKE